MYYRTRMGSVIVKRRNGREYLYWVRSERRNGKPRIVEQVYLGTPETVRTRQQAAEPSVVRTLNSGPVVLWQLAERMGIRELIDEHVTATGLDHTVGELLQLIVVNRLSAPCSKLRVAQWHERSALPMVSGISARDADHRRLWNAMGMVDEQAIDRIEQALVSQLVARGAVTGDVLMFDPTNLFTFIASDNERSQLAQRGNNKQKRHDLRQVGLALLTTRDYQLPLLHHTYVGSQHDAPTLREVSGQLTRRCDAVLKQATRVTVVYDRGCYSGEALQLFEAGELSFVCGIQANCYRDQLTVDARKLRAVDGMDGYQSRRTRVTIDNRRYTLVCMHSDSFADKQQRGLAQTLGTARRHLDEAKRVTDSGRGRRTRGELEAYVATLTRAQHVKQIINVTITGTDDKPALDYHVDQHVIDELVKTRFGRSLLLTDRHDWTDEQIIGAYHGLNRNERAMHQLKNTDYIYARPIRHFTDQKIRVHLFCCVLALLLANDLYRQAHQHASSPEDLLDTLNDITQVTLAYGHGRRGRPTVRHTLAQLTPKQTDLLAALNIDPDTLTATG